MARFADNHYARLGVPKDATLDEIQKAYREAARRFHPDTRQENTGTELFLGVQEAYEILSNTQRRSAYDLTLPQTELFSGIEVDVEYSRSFLIPSSEPQLLYVLVEFKVMEAVKDNTAPPINLGIVIDRSTSMKGMRMDMVKSTARQLLRQLKEQDLISVVVFSDRAEIIVAPTRTANLTRIEAQISQVQVGGATEIYQGLRMGVEQVGFNTRVGNLNHVILITDGHTYGDEEACFSLAEQARDQGITISGLGIGSEWNDTFVDKLVSITGGSSQYVSNPKDIKRFMDMKFKGITKTYAESIQLDGNLSEEVELRYAFRLQPEPGKLSVDKLPLQIGNITQDQVTQVLLEFLIKKLPATNKEFQVMDGRLRMILPSRIIPASRIFINIARSTNLNAPAEPPPKSIMDAMSKLTLFRMQEQARLDIAEGRIEEGTRRLQNLATNLLAQGQSSLATAVLGEARRLQRGEDSSPELQKHIKYGTRGLLLPAGMED